MASGCEVIQCSLANVSNPLNDVNNDNSAVTGISGDLASDCSVTSCQPGYNIAGDANSCVLNTVACNSQNVINNGGDVSNALTFKGTVVGLDESACLIESCSSDYNVASDEKSCEVKQCSSTSDLNIDRGITNFTGVDVASISGDYVAGCTYSCQTGYDVNTTNTSIACDSTTPTISFNISQTHTNQETNRAVSINGSNINEVQIWQSSNCTGTVYQSWTSSIPSSVNIYSLNSNNVYSARSRNSSNVESNCVSDSIIHDNIAPVVNINSQSINGSSYRISWSIVEANHNRTYYYLNNSSVGNTTSLSRTIDFSPLVFGSNTVRINPRDRANNQTNENVTFDYTPTVSSITSLSGSQGETANITLRVNKTSGAGLGYTLILIVPS